MENLMDPKKYGNVDKLFRVTVYVTRFIKNMQARVKKSPCNSKSLTIDEINQAEILWILSSQKLLIGKTKQLKISLGLYSDDQQIIRCKGQLNLSNLPYNQKNLILFPGTFELSTLLIHQAHLKVLHGGCKDTLTQLRSNQ